MHSRLRCLGGVFVILITSSASAAFASAGGRYETELPKLAQAEATPAEQASQDAWNRLRDHVPDLDEADAGASNAVTAVPKTASVEPVFRVCKRVAEPGTRIKRRVCTPGDRYRRKRDDMLTRQVYGWEYD
ncbi:MAG: hypothetical protein AAFX85_13360 [Pseudomonadota bacterium]